MTDTTHNKPAQRRLPDYEATLRKNARRVLRDRGVPADQVDAEWERLRRQRLPFDLPTNDELDAMSARDGAHDIHSIRHGRT